MKILILGSKGMLGHDLCRVFLDLKPVCWDRDDLDICDEKSVYEKIGGLKPDIVINAAAYTDVDGCEINRDLAMKVDGYAVGYLGRVCQKIGAVLVHYSTDYVFDGKNLDGYKENDEPRNPINVYGESKLLGEKLLQENCEKYFLIRTSWLFGKNGKNFVDTILRLGREKEEIKVVNDQHGKPTYSFDLATAIKKLLIFSACLSFSAGGSSASAADDRLRSRSAESPSATPSSAELRKLLQERRAEVKFLPGIYHITNEEETTWYDFACEIFRQAKELGILRKIPKIIPCASAEFPRPAKRPAYSILINTKLPSMRIWREALTDYLKEVRYYSFTESIQGGAWV